MRDERGCVIIDTSRHGIVKGRAINVGTGSSIEIKIAFA
jgi:hypothetical protein